MAGYSLIVTGLTRVSRSYEWNVPGYGKIGGRKILVTDEPGNGQYLTWKCKFV